VSKHANKQSISALRRVNVTSHRRARNSKRPRCPHSIGEPRGPCTQLDAVAQLSDQTLHTHKTKLETYV